jgi:hypothetical protein
VLARDEKAGAVRALVQRFMPQLLQEDVRTEAGEAQTRSAIHDNVSDWPGDGCTAGAVQPRRERCDAVVLADLQNRSAHHHTRRLAVVYCVDRHHGDWLHPASLLVLTLWAHPAGPSSRGRGCCRCTSQFTRACPHVHSDTGFELGVRKYPLWLEIQPSGPLLQRITRSPRSRPSLHGSA